MTDTHTHTHTHTDIHTGLVLDVNIFSYEMTEYKNISHANFKMAVIFQDGGLFRHIFFVYLGMLVKRLLQL